MNGNGGQRADEQRSACDVGRAWVKAELHERTGEFDWTQLRRRVPIALPRPWTLGEVMLAFGCASAAAFVGFLTVLGGVSFWRALVGG